MGIYKGFDLLEKYSKILNITYIMLSNKTIYSPPPCFASYLTPMNYTQSIEEFLSYLRIHRNASPKTVDQYELHLWKFFEFIEPSICAEAQKILPHIDIFITPADTPEKRAEKMRAKMFLR